MLILIEMDILKYHFNMKEGKSNYINVSHEV